MIPCTHHESHITNHASQLAREILDACHALGFASAGIAPAEPTAHRNELLDWLAAGKHGSMHWMTELLDERLDIRALLPGARAVIMVADQYADPADTSPPASPPDPANPRGRIARYARGRDYHKVIKRRLHTLADRLRERHPTAEFRTFVDTGPVLEREHAARAGLGWIGKHTLLIDPRRGSWLLLGGIATTLDIRADHPTVTDHCGTCTRCIDACPTQAITPYSVDARRCISYLTIEHTGDIDPAFHRAIGDNLIGCDICQEVCPFNDPHPHAHEKSQNQSRVNPTYRETAVGDEGGGVQVGDSTPGRSLPLLEVLKWTNDDRTRQLSASAAKRATLDMLKRNAAIVLANLNAGSKGEQQGSCRVQD